MKKILILIVCLFVLTGCESNIDINDYDKILDTFLSKNTSLVNNYSNGYKYYLPSGVRVIESENYNEKLYSNGYTYYLFVDLVSYYYETVISYTPKIDIYYSKDFEYKEKKGYIEIVEDKELYKIYVYYNFASIETYVFGNDTAEL